MASIQRTRSLRRPAAATADLAPDDASSGDRNASPSRLPVKFHSRSRSTITINDANTTTTTTRTRPTSTILGRSSANKTTALSTNAAQEPTKRETSRYPPSTTLTRQQAGPARPGSSGSAAPVKRVAAHARAKSTTSSVNTSTVLRPPSREQPTNTATRVTTHRRNASVDRSNTNNALQTPTKPVAQAQQPRIRPAFSTLQQHYSPAKTLAPKPLTATYLAPPSPSKLPANVAASAETNRLQAELLQLHLLHRDASAVEKAWRESAKTKLGERFAKLDEASREVETIERDRAEVENVIALRRWNWGDGNLDQKIQALDAIMNGVWALSDPGGRYARTVRRFERWIDRVNEIEEIRSSGTALIQGGNLFISELQAAWKEECPGLIRKLDAWQLQLKELGEMPQPPDDGSQPASLIRMLRGCGSLIRTMLAELIAMDDIEREALEREDEWIGKVNREDDDDDTPRAGAIWRSFNER